MPILTFTVLKDKLLSKEKCQTIRRPRKKSIEVGDKVYLYWKLRTKETEKLGEGIVEKVERKKMSDLTQEDAIRDGFSDQGSQYAIALLLEALQKLHPNDDLQVYVDIITWRWF